MSFLKLAKSRYSVRSFRQEPVPQEVVGRIIEAGLAAPTACNNQPQRIKVVSTPDDLALLKKCTECHFNAPLAFIVSADKSECWKRRYDGKLSADIDASIVATHMMLEAADEGVGSTWVMYFIPEAVTTEFALPEEVEPIAILVMGYPAESAQPSPMHTAKKDPAQIVRY